MSLGHQILWGAIFLGLCLLVQLATLILCSGVLQRLAHRFEQHANWMFLFVMMATTLVFIVVNHTIQVWIWALALIWADVILGWNTAIYFSLVTYSTVGYGDITLGPAVRIFAAFGGVTGILAFGVSTAYLVAVMTRVLRQRMGTPGF